MSNIHSISTFINQFQGGTRPNRFRITGTAPAGVGDLFGPEGIYCMASSLPESNVGIIPIPFRGRIYKFPGDRSYNEWTVTILDDNGTQLWGTWHRWSEKFNSHVDNLAAARDHKSNFCTITVHHLDHQSDAVVKSIALQNAWPVQVGPVQLDMGAANQLVQFQVQIAYSHYTSPLVSSGPR
jgi:hypothetical protein